MDLHYLTPLFAPHRVLAFCRGVSGTVSPHGQRLREHLTAQPFQGELTLVDLDTPGTLADLAGVRADLAVMALEPNDLPPTLELAARLGCRAAVLLGPDWPANERTALQHAAKRHALWLLGPGGLGLQRPPLGLNASLAGPLARSGSLGLVCQSGALTAAILDWAEGTGVGFSTVASLSGHGGVDVADVLDFLANDGKTQGIVLHLEGIDKARRFMSALRAAAHAKPVVVLKAGRQAQAQQVAQTHSGSTVGPDDGFDAALRRAGAVRVHSFVELFSAVQCLASRHRPVGKRLAVVTNGGGPGVLAVDQMVALGLELGTIDRTTQQAIADALPPGATFQGLVDLTENATPEAYVAALKAAAADPGIDGLLALHAPKVGADALAAAQAVANLKPSLSKPLLACWMGDRSVQEARKALNDAAVPSFRTPEAAVGAFGHIASFYENQQMLQQTPPPRSSLAKPDLEGARLLIEGILAERRTVLTEMESKALLAAFHVPVTQTLLARNATEAMMIATQLGFPVAMKIDSPDIAHKSDVDGVVLNLPHATAVRDAFNGMVQAVARCQPQARIQGVTIQKMARSRRGREVCIGVVSDERFGPLITFGAGGTMIELIDDRAVELPPLNQFLAQRLIGRARVTKTLGPWRGAPAADRQALEPILLRVSEMVCELPQLQEMDINPLIVDDQGAVAVDARVVLRASAVASNDYAHLAILPYPAHHDQVWPLPGGGDYTIRPIRPDDADMLQALVRSLSPESRYFRFVSSLTELPAAMLSRFTLIDYDREMALVAVHRPHTTDPASGEQERNPERIVGVSRYVRTADGQCGEFALVVADAYGGKGIGSRLMLSIMDVARERGLLRIEGLVLANNPGMLKLMTSLGFRTEAYPEDPDFRLVSHTL